MSAEREPAGVLWAEHPGTGISGGLQKRPWRPDHGEEGSGPSRGEVAPGGYILGLVGHCQDLGMYSEWDGRQPESVPGGMIRICIWSGSRKRWDLQGPGRGKRISWEWGVADVEGRAPRSWGVAHAHRLASRADVGVRREASLGRVLTSRLCGFHFTLWPWEPVKRRVLGTGVSQRKCSSKEGTNSTCALRIMTLAAICWLD